MLPVLGAADLGAAFRQRIKSSVVTLFVSGELDGNTPPEQMEEVWAGFSAAGRLTVRNGGHGSAFRVPAAWPVIVSFLNGAPVADEVVDGPPVVFTRLRR